MFQFSIQIQRISELQSFIVFSTISLESLGGQSFTKTTLATGLQAVVC